MVAEIFAGALFGRNIALGQLVHHVQVRFADVREREFGIAQLRNREDVLHQPAREPNTARPDHGYLMGISL